MVGLLTVLSNAMAAPIDVTAKVREAVRDNVLSIAVNNSAFGDRRPRDKRPWTQFLSRPKHFESF